MARHLSFEYLVDLAEGRLSPTEQTAALEQIAANPAAQREYQRITRLLGLLQADQSEDVPEYVLQRAYRIFQTPTAAPTTLQRIVAIMRFDSWAMPLASGLRTGSAITQQLLFQADQLEISLQLSQKTSGWICLGQLLGSTGSGSVQLIQPSFEQQQPLNELQEFHFSELPAGTYQMVIEVNNQQIIIDPLIIGSSSSKPLETT